MLQERSTDFPSWNSKCREAATLSICPLDLLNIPTKIFDFRLHEIEYKCDQQVYLDILKHGHGGRCVTNCHRDRLTPGTLVHYNALSLLTHITFFQRNFEIYKFCDSLTEVDYLCCYQCKTNRGCSLPNLVQSLSLSFPNHECNKYL